MIDPRGMMTFLAVCREGSISGGARVLNISQPSVSNAIAQLEHRLGASLFERSRSGIVLTAEGSALARQAEAMEVLLKEAESEIALTKQGIRGPLRIGGTPGALVSLLPDAIARLDGRGGNFSLHIFESTDRELVDMLRKGEIELAFVTTEIESPDPDMEEITLSRDPFALIVGKKNDHLPSRLSLKEAEKLSWVLPEAQGAFRRQIYSLFVSAGVPVPSQAVRCDSLLATKAIVRGSERVTILPTKVAAAELSIGVLRSIAIDEATFDRSVGIRKLVKRKLSPLAADILKALVSKP